MARINTSNMDIRGSIGNWTFSRNRYGAYVKRKVSPVNPSSAPQIFSRNALAQAATFWKEELSAAQKIQWNIWSDNSPQTNVFGQQVYITAMQAFCRMNALRIKSGLAIKENPPTEYGAAAALIPDPTSSSTLSLDVSENAMTLNDYYGFFSGYWSSPEFARLFVYISGKSWPDTSMNYYKTGWKYLGNFMPTGGSPMDIEMAIPFTLQEGRVYKLRWRGQTAEGNITPWAELTRTAINP